MQSQPVMSVHLWRNVQKINSYLAFLATRSCLRSRLSPIPTYVCSTWRCSISKRNKMPSLDAVMVRTPWSVAWPMEVWNIVLCSLGIPRCGGDPEECNRSLPRGWFMSAPGKLTKWNRQCYYSNLDCSWSGYAHSSLRRVWKRFTAHRDRFMLSALFGDTKMFAFVERVHIGGIQVNQIWRIK